MSKDAYASGRQLKKAVLQILPKSRFREELAPLVHAAPRKLVNALISNLYHPEEIVRWRAVVGMGITIKAMVPDQFESARVVMRRLMWSLNDESGGIGWGAPESMGEIMAVCKPMAREYTRILTSYLQPHGNFIEYPPLQRGVLWAIGRLGYARPLNVKGIGPFLLPFMHSRDPCVRGLSAWAAGTVIGEPGIGDGLKRLFDDRRTLSLFREGQLQTVMVSALAREAQVRLP